MRSAFLNLLRGEQTGEIVWTADLSYWMEGRRADGTARPEWFTEQGFLELHREHGIFPYYYYEKFCAFQVRYDGPVTVEQQARGNTTLQRITCPAGELTCESAWMPESCCSGITKHFVENVRDLDVFLDLLQYRRLLPANLDDYPQRLAAWEAWDGIPGLALPRSPLAAMTAEWAGVEHTVYLLLDCEEKMRAAMALLEEQEAPILDAVCALAPPIVHFIDNLSSENLTTLYDEFMADRHRARLQRLHHAGTAGVVHLDGTVKGLLPKLATAGFDAAEALTPQPAGDLDLAEIRALVDGTKTILWGGVPGVMFAPPYTWDDMRRHLERLLETWAGHPFVIGVADQVPPDGDISFCQRIAEMIR